VLDIRELSYESLVSLINAAWMKREEISAELGKRIGTIRQKALKNAEIVARLIEKEKSSRL
jgi:predicted transcriptional regulator